MRKLIFQQFLSLDGFAADKNKSTSFFESPEYSVDSDDDLLKEMDRFDTILLGANTYKMFADYWPTATNDEQIVADKLNSIPKVVFSSSLSSAPWGKWDPAKLIAGDAVEAIRQMKNENGRDMVLWGSISLSKDLINANLIDEYQFRIVPVILGDGVSQFESIKNKKLEMAESKTYSSGLLFVKYIPV